MTDKARTARNTRRKFLKGAAVAGAAVATPTVVKAQGPISMRWQSTWPSKDIFHEYAQDFAKKVNDMTGGGPVLLRTNMGAGHGGAAGRFDRLDEVAIAYAFALRVTGTVTAA